jgi:hypothetical protein
MQRSAGGGMRLVAAHAQHAPWQQVERDHPCQALGRNGCDSIYVCARHAAWGPRRAICSTHGGVKLVGGGLRSITVSSDGAAATTRTGGAGVRI